MAIVDEEGRVLVKLVIFGDSTPVGFLGSLHQVLRNSNASEVFTDGDDFWRFSTFTVRLRSESSSPLTIYLFAHEGFGFPGTKTKNIKKVFSGTDAIIALFSPDREVSDVASQIETMVRCATQKLDAKMAFDQFSTVAVGVGAPFWSESARTDLTTWAGKMGATVVWVGGDVTDTFGAFDAATKLVLRRLERNKAV